MKLKNIKIRLFGITDHFKKYDLVDDPRFTYQTQSRVQEVKKYFSTFAANLGEKFAVLESAANRTKWFDGLFCFNADERLLDEIGLDENARIFIEKNKRGYGYWLWKPYFIKYCLSLIPDDALLFYTDVGGEINVSGELIFNEMSNMAYDHGGLFFDMPFIEQNWTKRSVLTQFKEIDRNSRQVQANFFILKKNQRTVTFIDEWVQLATERGFKNIVDSTDWESIKFIEHRHDQSIFSCLAKKYVFKIVPQVDNFNRCLYKDNVEWIKRYPIHSLRSKTGNTYFK